MHSPSRVQIPPSPQSLTAIREPRPRLGRGFAVCDTAGVSASAASLRSARTKLKALCVHLSTYPLSGNSGRWTRDLHLHSGRQPVELGLNPRLAWSIESNLPLAVIFGIIREPESADVSITTGVKAPATPLPPQACSDDRCGSSIVQSPHHNPATSGRALEQSPRGT